MNKIDLKRELKELYTASVGKPVMVDVPDMAFLTVDGTGDPNTVPAFHQGVQALYGLAYTLKFMMKKGPRALDYPVMALEGLWCMDDMTQFRTDRKDEWKWTLMIMQPDIIAAKDVAEARGQLEKRKNPPALSKLRFERFHEGLSAQILHIGPYSEEGPTIEKLHTFIRNSGHELRGKHHEIYLSDPRRAAPDNWKTILRQPVSARKVRIAFGPLIVPLQMAPTTGH